MDTSPIPISIPAVVVLMGSSGSGKSTFARTHFFATEILSSDAFRAAVSDDENDQSATADAFQLLYFVARKRLSRGRLCVIDATNVRAADRHGYVELAREFQCQAIAVVFTLDIQTCLERTSARSDRIISLDTVRKQHEELIARLKDLPKE